MHTRDRRQQAFSALRKLVSLDNWTCDFSPLKRERSPHIAMAVQAFCSNFPNNFLPIIPRFCDFVYGRELRFRNFQSSTFDPIWWEHKQKIRHACRSTDCQYSNLGIRKLTWSVSVMKNLVPRKTWAACKTYLLLVTLAFFPERSTWLFFHIFPLPALLYWVEKSSCRSIMLSNKYSLNWPRFNFA